MMNIDCRLKKKSSHDDSIWASDEKYLEFHERLLAISEQIERSPELKAEWNQRVLRDRVIEVSFCEM
jgi:hypothetical protein